jgi:uracil-DNA glycosylase family 4
VQDLREVSPTPESIIGCENCPFKSSRIGGRGPFDSPFVIVGESPGATELAKKMPFMGPSGRMLMDILEEVGFNDLGVEPYITNALSCWPPPEAKGMGNNAMASATQCCQGRLHKELQAHPREVILTLGASAAWSVTGDYGIKITRDRGKVLKSTLASKGVVLAVHPAYLLRNGGGLPFWRKDLETAVQLYQGTLVTHWQEPTWEVITTRARLKEVVAEYLALKSGSLATGDFETDGLNALFNRVLMLGITHNGRHIHIIDEDCWYANLDLIKVLMEAENLRWNWHNGKFDVQWIWASTPAFERVRNKLGFKGVCGCCSDKKDDEALAPYKRYREPLYINGRVDEDTMLLSYTNNENAGFHDLDQTAQAWIQAPAHKGVMSKYYKMAPHYSLRNAPKAELHRYAAYDIAKTHLQWKPLREQVGKDQRLVNLYYNTLIPASHFFARIERYGVQVDKEKVKENMALEDMEIKEINSRLQVYAREYLGHEINFGSWQQLRPLIWGKMKLGPPGAERSPLSFASDEDALVDAQRRTNHPILHDLLLYREVVKRKGTYVVNLIDHYKTVTSGNKKKLKFVKGITYPDCRVHASVKIHGTTTGRPACSAPNLLNQPRIARIRDQYKAEEGKVYVEVDLNQAELRSLCQLSKDPLLTEIYRSNEISIHDVTAKAFFASKKQMLEEPEVMLKCAALMQVFAELRREDHKCDYCDDIVPGGVAHLCASRVYKEAKMAAKTVNFGIVYGREAHSIAQVFNISHQEAQRWIDTWLETYSGAAKYIRQCRDTVIRNQKMVTPWGRMKRVGVATPEKLNDLQNQAANFPHQSIAHDILLEAAMECEPFLVERGAFCWNEVYDAVYFEVEANERVINECIDQVCKVITEVPVRKGLTHIPFIGDAKVGQRWGSMKDWKGSFAASGFSQ